MVFVYCITKGVFWTLTRKRLHLKKDVVKRDKIYLVERNKYYKCNIDFYDQYIALEIGIKKFL